MKLKLIAAVDKSKEWRLDYDEVRPASEGLSVVKRDLMYGFVDEEGQEVIPTKFLDARPFSGGRAAVKLFGTKWGYIDKKGDVAVPIQYEEVDNYFHNGRALVKLNGHLFYIDVDGNRLV